MNGALYFVRNGDDLVGPISIDEIAEIPWVTDATPLLQKGFLQSWQYVADVEPIRALVAARTAARAQGSDVGWLAPARATDPFAPPRAASELPSARELAVNAKERAERTARRDDEVRLYRVAGWFLFFASLSVTVIVGGTLALVYVFTDSEVNVLGFGIHSASVLTYGGLALRLRAFDSRFRIPSILAALPLLLAFPIGTIVAARIVVFLAGKQAAFLFSTKYREIRSATPDMDVRGLFVVTPVMTFIAAIVVFWMIYQIISAQHA